MTIHTDYDEQAKDVIEEYILAANILLESKKENGGVYGYAALVLIFSVIDAVGQSDKPTNGANLKCLKEIQSNLTEKNIEQITQWFRNSLIHVGTIPQNIIIHSREVECDPFIKHEEEVTEVEVKCLLKKVRDFWETRKKTFKAAKIREDKKTGLSGPIYNAALVDESIGTTITPASSGCVNIDPKSS